MNGIAYTNKKKKKHFRTTNCDAFKIYTYGNKNEKKAVLNYFIVLNGYYIVDRERESD